MVYDRPLASRFPYRVQGQAMCPVRWSLKNQRTAPAQPIADILRGIGIGVCMVVAALAGKRMFLARAQRATVVTTFTGVGSGHFLHRDTSKLCFLTSSPWLKPGDSWELHPQDFEVQVLVGRPCGLLSYPVQGQAMWPPSLSLKNNEVLHRFLLCVQSFTKATAALNRRP